MQNAWLALVLIACHGGTETAGRVELATEDGMLVVRDSMHVLELPLTATHGIPFETIELRAGVALPPGTIMRGNAEHNYLLGVWITRLGSKRPENIQRWFDDKLASIRGESTYLENHGEILPGNHPARFADFTHKTHDSVAGRVRLFGVDLPEHDLDLILYAGVVGAEPDATQLAWLDGITADVKAIRIAPKP